MQHASRWTPEQVIEICKILPPVYEDEAMWEKVWMRDVTEFGLSFKMGNPELPYSDWDEDMWGRMETVHVKTSLIKHSSQTKIRLDVLDWYLKMPVWKENFDTDGWFGNNHPVLMQLPNGVYTIKDGNHRIISRIIAGFEVVEAYVMKGI